MLVAGLTFRAGVIQLQSAIRALFHIAEPQAWSMDVSVFLGNPHDIGRLAATIMRLLSIETLMK
jgi:hypothetical protein